MNALVEIQGEKYNYKIGYRDNELLRRSFNELAEKTFGIKKNSSLSLLHKNDKNMKRLSLHLLNIIILVVLSHGTERGI